MITLIYAVIAIHDIPYEIAKHRNHPHQDAIHLAGWVSLHAIWPFLWIWAMHPSDLALLLGSSQPVVIHFGLESMRGHP